MESDTRPQCVSGGTAAPGRLPAAVRAAPIARHWRHGAGPKGRPQEMGVGAIVGMGRRSPETRGVHWTLSLAALLLAASCARGTAPMGAGGLIEAEPAFAGPAEDLRLTLRTGAWDHYPRDLAAFVTPVHVALHNQSDRPVAVTLESFVLRDTYGAEHHALPPQQVARAFYRVTDQPRRQPAPDPRGVSRPSGQSVAASPSAGPGPGRGVQRAFHRGYYGSCGLPPPLHYGPEGAELGDTPLLRFAFPEGEIAPDAHRGGYLYFEKLRPKTADQRYTLHVDLHARVKAPRPAAPDRTAGKPVASPRSPIAPGGCHQTS